MGGAAGAAGAAARGWGAGTVLLVVAGSWLASFLIPLGLAAAGGTAAGTIHNPSGRTTPSRREHSHAESLVARGLHREAIDVLEIAVGEDASDPDPYLRIARIYRDRLHQYEDSARWFKRGLRESAPSVGMRRLIVRELVELYSVKLGDPKRAAPLLARVVEEEAGTVEAEWAAAELARVKEIMSRGEP